MRTALLIGRLCFRNGYHRVRPSLLRPHHRLFSAGGPASRPWFRRPPIIGPVLLCALTPAAFIQISEEEYDDGKTGEDHMLEASRKELQETKSVPENVHGIQRAWRGLVYVFDQYIFEPIATGFRFLHLVIIFVPVIFSVPTIYFGRRHKDRDNERGGALWWYGFLVHSMERAGAAFIKVMHLYVHINLLLMQLCSWGNGQLHDKTYSQ